jgi:ketosteroid isomerase-like protein
VRVAASNAAILRAHFEAANERRYEDSVAYWADDVELVVEGSLIGSIHRGKDAVVGFFGDWFRAFGEGPLFEFTRVEEVGDAVALEAHAVARGAKSGVELGTDYFYVYRFREGKIVHIQFYEDWEQARAAAEATEA